MKIIVSENQFGKIMGSEGLPTETLIEQVATTNPGNKLLILQQKINDILNDPKREKAMLDNLNLNVVLVGDNAFELHIGNKKLPMKQTVQGVFVTIIPKGRSVSTSKVPVSLLMPQIEKLPEYKEMIEGNPKIKAQLDRMIVHNQLYAGDTAETSYFEFRVKGGDSSTLTRADKKMAVDITRSYPLGEFFARNEAIFKFPKQYGDMYGVLKAHDLDSDLTGINLVPAPPKVDRQTQVAPTPVVIQFRGLGDVFNFGEVTFKNEEKTHQELQSFIQQLKGYAEEHGPSFIEHIKRQTPTVYGYASIDGDPDQQIVGQYKPCSGNKTRKDYDLCLSTERAKLIAEILNQGLTEYGGAFQYKGIGETTEWGPGWAPGEGNETTPEQTAPNRRYLLSKLKGYQSRTNRG